MRHEVEGLGVYEFPMSRYKMLVQLSAPGPLSIKTCGCSFQIPIETNRDACTR